MDDLLIEGIDDDMLREIAERARRNGRTVEAEAAFLLELGVAKELSRMASEAKNVVDAARSSVSEK